MKKQEIMEILENLKKICFKHSFFKNGKLENIEVNFKNLIVENLFNIFENDISSYNKDAIVFEMMKYYISYSISLLNENCTYLFEESIEVSQSNFNKAFYSVIKEYENASISISEITKEEFYEDIYNFLLNDIYFEWYNSGFDRSYILNIIKYKDLTSFIEDNTLEIDIDDLDNYANEVIDYFIYLKISNFEEVNEIYLNVFPFQDGNDEGEKLGVFLDFIATKVDECYYPYYIHSQSRLNNVPECIKFLLKSQGYTIDDILNKEKDSDFCKSLREEILCEQNSLQFLVFLIKTNLDGLYDILAKKNIIVIPKETTCGFANIVHGSIGGLNIKMEKDIKLNNDSNTLFQFEIDDVECYGYKISEICGFSEHLYTDLKI